MLVAIRSSGTSCCFR